GQKCVDVPNDGCDPAAGGKDCAGLCQPSQPGQCKADAQCPQVQAPCVACPDGIPSCPKSYCLQGVCKVEYPTCGNPNPQCQTDGDCAPGPQPCKQCADGTSVCPKTICNAGQCQIETFECPPPAPGCKADKDCPQSAAPCKACADGKLACPAAWCD